MQGQKELFELQKSLPLYEQIYHSIKELIFQGKYQPGEKISEVQIAKNFGVSRSPVREAVRALMNDGLITMDDKSQLKIYKPTIGDVEDIYQCRSSLESLAVKLTTQRATDEDLQQIEELLNHTEMMIEKNEKPGDIIELNTKFHDLIIQFSNNKLLKKNLKDLWSLTYFYRVMNFKGENRPRIILAEHKEIFEQIKRRDVEIATVLMTKHIMNDLYHLKSLL